MFVLDNFFPSKLIDSVIAESYNYEWVFKKQDIATDVYWTNFLFGENYDEPNESKNQRFFKNFNSEQCWEFFKKKTDCGLTNDNLESSYVNGLTYGLEAHAHTDSDKKNFVTVIVYLCENWNSYWGGETVFFNGEFVVNDPTNDIFYTHEIIKTVLPRYNRIVMFDGNIVHAVRSISKSFKGLRKTMMFKIKNKNIKEFEKLCS